MAQLINPQTGSSSIYDPTLPNRVAQGAPVPQQPPITSLTPGQGPQYDPSFGADAGPTPTPQSAPASPLTYAPSFAATGNYQPSFNANAPGISSILAQSARPDLTARTGPWGTMPDLTARTPRPGVATRGAGGGPNVNGIFGNLPDNVFSGAGGGNQVQTAQAPASATPQGWNLFTALGQALGHLLGYNAGGQPQGMSGLLRTPAPPTSSLRMPSNQAANRYQGRTLVG